MKKDFVKYIKKLRLVKGRDYILFIPKNCLPFDGIRDLAKHLNKAKIDSLIIHTKTNKGIKIIEA